MDDELVRLPARRVVQLLRQGELRPVEVLAAARRRIEAVDPLVNALPIRCFERAIERAEHVAPRNDSHPAWLAGLPVVIKDNAAVEGVRTTYGSTIYADHVPAQSEPSVRKIEAAGGLVVAKSNIPEFCVGAQTFNSVFGTTLNPWDTSKTCGGSSGGSAVALATGMAWLAHGSDFAGSVRTPASFCSVVGVRPSPGVVPRAPGLDAFEDTIVQGPMARDVEDAALLLDAMAGLAVQDPHSLPAPAISFQQAVRERRPPARVAWSADLGLCPVDREVSAVCRAAAMAFEQTGARVDEAHPDFSGAMQTWQTIRAMRAAVALGPMVEQHRERLKPEVVWGVEKGLQLTPDQYARAVRERVALYARVVRFFEHYDVLALPAAIVPPFDAGLRHIDQVNGQRFDNFVDWLAITYALSLTRCPCLSMPCGFTASGLPVGLQLVGRPRGDALLLAHAACLQEALQLRWTTPIAPRLGRGWLSPDNT